jgi:hypothetical protein
MLRHVRVRAVILPKRERNRRPLDGGQVLHERLEGIEHLAHARILASRETATGARHSRATSAAAPATRGGGVQN